LIFKNSLSIFIKIKENSLIMRRPSRQGLLPVCTSGTNVLLTASLIVLIALVVIPRMGHTQDVPSILSAYFSEVRGGDHPSPPMDVLTTASPETIFSTLQPYLLDSVNTVRAKACEIVHLIGLHTSKEESRTNAVDILFRAYTDDDPETNRQILTYLTKHPRKSFSATARDSIRSLVRIKPMYFDQILRLAGFLELRDLKNEIRPWTQPGNPSQIRWAALLSLARMGDSFAISDIYNRIKNLTVNDDVVYQVFPDLIYTRQQALYAPIAEALHQKDKGCMSADAEREVPIPCGYRIMEQLAPVIDGFPFSLAPGGDLRAPDYAKALEEVRAWFETNTTYTILNDFY
jgi:hypothetical protein